jgi:hypothetical protein
LLWLEVGNVGDDIRDIDHLVAAHHAETEIVEEHELHAIRPSQS